MAEKNPLRAWEKEKALIPGMIRTYCHGHHGTRGKEICADCADLTEYALFRLGKCPLKENKKFCSFCRIHCYKPDYRVKIKAVMRYSGPRMLFTHPIFAIDHVVQMLQYKKAQKSAGEAEK